MLEKNKEKEKRKHRKTWLPYYPRIVENKKKYKRKSKHQSQNYTD